MTFGPVVAWVLVAFAAAIWGLYLWISTPASRAQDRAAQKAKRARQRQDRLDQPKHLICPHCQTKGSVTSRSVTRKKGISGGKATGAVVTGGASVFLTGLSRTEGATQMHCSNCGTTWNVA